MLNRVSGIRGVRRVGLGSAFGLWSLFLRAIVGSIVLAASSVHKV